jgi:hypothetical protein
MTALDAALHYAGHWGKPVFPVLLRRNPRTGKLDKIPLVKEWGLTASTDPAQIAAWWKQWPNAAIGIPTGARSGFVVLDIDTKEARANGYNTLDALGKSLLPETPMAHTPSGGLHVYFATIGVEIRNSAGAKGLGPGLDVRGEGGYVVVPCAGSGYGWDPHWNLDTVPLMPAPAWLGHRQHQDRPIARHGLRLDPQTILDTACENIRHAAPGERHDVLNREVFTSAALVAAGALNERDTRHQLEAAATAMAWSTAGDRQKAARDFEDAWRDGLATRWRAA